MEGAQAQAAHSFILSAVAVQSLSATLRAHYRALGHSDAECAVAGWSLLKVGWRSQQNAWRGYWLAAIEQQHSSECLQ